MPDCNQVYRSDLLDFLGSEGLGRMTEMWKEIEWTFCGTFIPAFMAMIMGMAVMMVMMIVIVMVRNYAVPEMYRTG